MRAQHPWLKLSLILLLALITRIVLAEEKWADEVSGRAKRVASVTREAVTGSGESSYLLNLGTGVAAISDQMGWVMNWGALARVTSHMPWFVGADIGVHYWRQSPVVPGNSMTGIQVMATSLYSFDLGRHSFLTPYLGLSAGPFLRYREREGLAASLSLVLRPGMRFRFTDVLSLSLEPRLGLMESNLLVQGQASAVFTL